MARRRKKTVKDILSWADIGEMLLSFFAIVTVLASPTLVPAGIQAAGIWLVAISVIVIYISLYMMIRMKADSLQDEARLEALYHLSSAFIVTLIGTLIAGTLYGMIWGRSTGEILDSPLTVAFSAGLLWSSVIDGLKGD